MAVWLLRAIPLNFRRGDMDFLLDESAGAKKIKTLLRKKGHNVKAMNESGLSGNKDPHVIEITLEENRFIVTCVWSNSYQR